MSFIAKLAPTLGDFLPLDGEGVVYTLQSSKLPRRSALRVTISYRLNIAINKLASDLEMSTSAVLQALHNEVHQIVEN
jgi:hypothetical protein